MAAFGFTPASGHDVFSIGSKSRRPKPSIELSGQEARQFYEDMFKETAGQATNRDEDCSRAHPIRLKNGGSSRNRRRVQPAIQREVSGGNQERLSERTIELLGLRLLHCAQEGNLSGMKELISKGADINYKDTFLWTAMMCASWSGQKDAVKLLLSHEAAWVGVVDTKGRDAQDLALEAGHKDVVEALLNYGVRPKKETQSVPQPEWCDVCRSEYRIDSSAHCSSTLHQFSLRRPLPTPYYCLPPSSNSYKMMVRSGWKPGTGLGPEGEGSQQPVPTVLKRDQQGLGYGQIKRAKVTHFKARDHEAVKLEQKEKEGRTLRGQRREETRRKEQRDKNWERDFRVSFYL